MLPFSANAPAWTTIELDQHGRLLYLLRAPRSSLAKQLDWRPLLDAAGLDATSLRVVPPKDAPLAPFDARAAWSGHYRGDRTPIRVEAAAWQGTPVAFHVTGVWDEETGAVERAMFGGRAWELFMLVATFVIVGIGIFLAWRNLRLRRGDRAGALRVGGVVFVLNIVFLVLTEVSFAGIEAVPGSLTELLGRAAVPALALFVLYIALEPYARRRWPEQLIAWARLIGGRPRDPLVGRHILIGLIGAMIHSVLANSTEYVTSGFVPELAGPLNYATAGTFIGVPAALGQVVGAAGGVIYFGCVYMIILVLLTMILRKRGLATAGIFAISLLFFYLALGHQPAAIPAFIAIAALQTFIVVRWGALAIGVFQSTFLLIFDAPFAPGASWATPVAAIPLLAVTALAVWAFLTSLGGQSPFTALD